MDDERFTRGWETLTSVHRARGHMVMDGLSDHAPELARFIVEFGYGDVYSRPGLPLRERQIATVAALTAMGTAPHELRVHIQAALNLGITREEVVEIVMQMALYAGFPAAVEGVNAAREAFAAWDEANPEGSAPG